MAAHRWKTEPVGTLDVCSRCGALRCTPLWPGVEDADSLCSEPERRKANRRAHDNSRKVSVQLGSDLHPCQCEHCRRATGVARAPQADDAVLRLSGRLGELGSASRDGRRAWARGAASGAIAALARLAASLPVGR